MSDTVEGGTATAVTTEIDPVTVRLQELGVEAGVITKIKTDLGAATVEDLVGLTESDLVAAGMKLLPARKLASALKKVAVEATSSAAGAVNTVSFDGVLPAVPDDTSWLTALRAGGVLKVDQSTVISAIRAALAHRAGLFDIPEKLGTAMEKFADANDEQVDTEYFKLRKQLTRRSYADIFAAIEGLDGNYVTEGRKKQLFERVDTRLWPAIVAFFEALKSWQETWMQGAASPAMMMNAFMLASSGGAGVMPPGMMQPPDTGVLRDNAAAVADAVNRVFAGTGVQIAAALAYDATQIKDTLTNPRLPALIGAANREQMLRQLDVAVSPTYPRLETNLTRFVLSVLQAQDQPPGNEELQFFGALYMLGSQIPWDQLGSSSGRPTGIGATRNQRSL
jgi:hypothetical protein